MNHALKGRFIFLFYRQAVTSVSHCDKIVSQHIARVVNRSRKLFAYSVVGAFDRSSDSFELRACIVCHFFGTENATGNLAP